MKKIVFINTVIGIGSTGKICVDLAKEYEKNGYIVKIAYGRGKCNKNLKKYGVKIGNIFSIYLHAILSRIFDTHGLHSKFSTYIFLKWLDKFSPDEIWLHGIHGYYINYEMLFSWLKKNQNILVKWTLHDCWSFTGHCAHYTSINCNKWQIECNQCEKLYSYPKSILFDNSKNNFNRKKNAFTSVKNLSIIVPSDWLKKQVELSFMKEYPMHVVNNTIDTNIFKKQNVENYRKNFYDKKIILSVASVWNNSKGLDDIIFLLNNLNEKFIYIIVGLKFAQIKKIVKENKFKICVSNLFYDINHFCYINKNSLKIVFIERTNNLYKLALLYNLSDYFINPTKEDNYPTVNLEANACGTKILTYDNGGSVESAKSNYEVFNNVKDIYDFLLKNVNI